jgi:electron transfer flavoprotein alpha/beta subunit
VNASGLRVVVLVRGAAELPIGACESSALAWGLNLVRGRAAGGTVTTISVGDAEEAAAARALAVGADRVIHVVDVAARTLDYRPVAELLASVVRREQPDLVLCGERSSDEALGIIGPAVAELEGLSHVTGAVDLALPDAADAVPDALDVTQRRDGHLTVLRMRLPLLVTVSGIGASPATLASAPRGAIERIALATLTAERPGWVATPAIPELAADRQPVLLHADAAALLASLRDERLL